MARPAAAQPRADPRRLGTWLQPQTPVLGPFPSPGGLQEGPPGSSPDPAPRGRARSQLLGGVPRGFRVPLPPRGCASWGRGWWGAPGGGQRDFTFVPWRKARLWLHPGHGPSLGPGGAAVPPQPPSCPCSAPRSPQPAPEGPRPRRPHEGGRDPGPPRQDPVSPGSTAAIFWGAAPPSSPIGHPPGAPLALLRGSSIVFLRSPQPTGAPLAQCLHRSPSGPGSAVAPPAPKGHQGWDEAPGRGGVLGGSSPSAQPGWSPSPPLPPPPSPSLPAAPRCCRQGPAPPRGPIR